MDDDPGALDEWMAYSAHDHGTHRRSRWHPIMWVAVVAGVVIVVAMVVLRPTGSSRELAEAQRSVLGLPTDFFDATVADATTGPCDFLPEDDCVAVSFEILGGPDEGRLFRQVFPVGGSTPEFAEGQRVVLSYRAPNGRVTAVTEGPCDFDAGASCDIVEVSMTRADRLGDTITVTMFPESVELAPGDHVEVTFDESGVAVAVSEATVASQYQFSDFHRTPVLAWTFLVFAVAVIALGGWRGVAALAGLGATILIVVLWLLPSILDGRDPALVALVGASAVAFVALYVSHGVTVTTTVALIGTLAALALTTVLSAVTVELASFTGLATEESSLLTIFGFIDVRGLVLAGMVLGAAGALDDVTVTQAAAVEQLANANPDADTATLWRGGVRIGQHHIGSTVNTLLLAYLGASLPLAILFVLAEQSLGTVLNSEVVAVEVVRTLVGSIGLVAAVPITTYLAARLTAGAAVRTVPGTHR